MPYEAVRDSFGRFVKGFSGNPNRLQKGSVINPVGKNRWSNGNEKRKASTPPRRMDDIKRIIRGNDNDELSEKQLDKMLKTNQKKMNDQKLLKLHHHRISIIVDKRLAEIEAEYKAGLKNG